MAFLLSKALWVVLAPGNLLLLLLAAAVLLLAAGARRAGLALAGAVLLTGVAIAATPLAAAVLAPLENRFPRPDAPPERIAGVIVLGGAIESRTSAARGMPLLGGAGDRLFAFSDMARRYPDAPLVFTGGSNAVFDTDAREADWARLALESLGVDADRVVWERDARNTRENALRTRERLTDLGAPPVEADAPWVLVTSAWHMPRAVGVFRAAGFTVTPWPTDYVTPLPPLGFDFASRLTVLTIAYREWLGLIAYRLFGWTESLYPNP